jgi:hypothetical protein
VVDETISDRCFVDDAMFGIEDVEPMIETVTIPAMYEIIMQLKNIVLHVPLKFLYVSTVTFALSELAPGGKKILQRNNLIKHMPVTPVFQKSYDFYKHLYVNLKQIPKRDRYTWGERCETMALEMISALAKATYAPRPQKQTLIRQASAFVDLLKIYLRLGFDLRVLDQKKYLARQGELQEMGKMLGGWMRSL